MTKPLLRLDITPQTLDRNPAQLPPELQATARLLCLSTDEVNVLASPGLITAAWRKELKAANCRPEHSLRRWLEHWVDWETGQAADPPPAPAALWLADNGRAYLDPDCAAARSLAAEPEDSADSADPTPC